MIADIQTIESPIEFHGQIKSLPEREQRYVLNNLEVFRAIDRATSIVAECKRQAQICQGSGLEGGWSWKRIHARYTTWRDSGRDWRTIVRQWNPGRNQQSLPPETIEWWRSEWARARGRQDTARATYTRLTQHWLSGEEVPGLGNIFSWWGETHPDQTMPHVSRIPRPELLPRGWSQTSFYAAVQPRCKAVARLLQHGSFAAHTHWPAQVLRDRSKLRPFECILFDDVRFDKQVLAQAENGEWQSVYPVGIVAIDLATGVDLGITLMPRLQRDDGGHHGITRDGLRLLLHQILSTFGLPTYPVELVVEKAAAAISKPDQAFLTETFGERIQIRETEMQDFARIKNGLKERHGTPWSKAWIEAYFRPLQTAIAHLLGSTGTRYDDNPGDLPALVKESIDLASRARASNIEVTALRGRLLTFDEFHSAIQEAMQILRWRTNHNLQGFDEIFEARLEDGSYQIIQDTADIPSTALSITSRTEAPVERMRRLVSGIQFSPVPPATLYQLLNEKLPVRIIQGKITVRNKRLQRKAGSITDPLIYWSGDSDLLIDERLWSVPLDGYFSADLEILHLVRDGAYLGSVSRWHRTDITDKDALADAAAEVGKARGTIVADMRRDYLAPQEAEQKSDRLHNRAILTAAEKMSEAETKHRVTKKKQRDIRQADFDTSALLSEETTETPDQGTDFNPADLL